MIEVVWGAGCGSVGTRCRLLRGWLRGGDRIVLRRLGRAWGGGGR